jgi:hypothetical protein
VLEKGSKGELVKRWQSFLMVEADGDFGPATEAATIAFQIKHGLRADGRVGPNTLKEAESLGFQRPAALTPKRIEQITGTPSAKLVRVSAKAPSPLMNAKVAPHFEALRKEVYEASGVDFLAVCGDIHRPASLRSNKDGVAFKSNHKTGRAIDYDQNNRALVIVSEPIGGKQFFRTYLKCANYSLGEIKYLEDYRGYNCNTAVIDFTALAAKHGFTRIPAWTGWKTKYNRREFWHYEKMDGLTWEQALAEIQ